jgi:transmembrane sensor
MAIHAIRYKTHPGMTRERLKYLLNRILENQATAEEQQEYADWYEKTTAKGPDMVEGQAAREYADGMYERILYNIKPRRVMYMRWVAAASVIIIAGAFLWLHNRSSSKPVLAETKTVRPDPSKKTFFENENSSNRKITLDDGSLVELFPHSKLASEYRNNSRELHLTGKAFFKVKKDSTRPFTVHSAVISTTALGTSFTITAFADNNNIDVQLHTGKVVIKQLNRKDVYMLAGNSFTYNKITGMASTAPIKAPAVNARPSMFGGRTGYKAEFNQTPLIEVLDAIEKEYAVPMRYNREQLQDMYYSGTILETDSLARVLKRIGLLHNLRIKETAIGYTIKKDQ